MTEPKSEGGLPTAAEGVALLAGLLLGGIAVGLAVALTAGGGTEGAIFVGIFTLPLALGAGFTVWRTILGAHLVGGLGRALIRSRGDEERFREETLASFAAIRDAGVEMLPGTWVFIPAAMVVGLVAGFVMALAAPGSGMLAGLLLFAATIAYGFLLRRLARSGRLLFPE